MHSVAPHQPQALCSISPSVLVYEDTSKNPRQLNWLDCSETKPKPLGIIQNLNLHSVQDMCVVESEKETLLIVISYYANELIYAFNSITGELKWSAPKKTSNGPFCSQSVTGDGNGRLYVTDATNNCIQMFSASDGQYLGYFIKQGDQGLGNLHRLQWSETSSSLVVGHHDNTTWSISTIH